MISTLMQGNDILGIQYFADVAQTIPAQILFSSIGIGPGTDQQLIMYNNIIPNQPVMVHITEFGPIGQFISGTFAGSFTSGGNILNVICSFRIRRTI